MGIRSDPRLNTDQLKQMINGVSQLMATPNQTTRTYLQLRKRLKQQNLALMKADKGETLIIMNRADYNKKVWDFLTQAGAKPIRYAFTDYNEKIRAILEKTSLIFGSVGKDLKVMNASKPRLYGQLKLHKKNQPIRPIVAYYTHPAYNIAKRLAKWFKFVTDFKPRYTIKNSLELAADLKGKCFPPSATLFSVDAVAMYTRIPVRYHDLHLKRKADQW